MGWNGTKYFTLKGTVGYEEVSEVADYKYELYDYATEYYCFLDYLYGIIEDAESETDQTLTIEKTNINGKKRIWSIGAKRIKCLKGFSAFPT